MGRFYERGYLLFEQGKYKLAEQELRRDLSEDPDSAFSHALLAACLEWQNEREKAYKEAKLAISCDPSYTYSYYIMAVIEFQRQKINEAEKLVHHAIELDHEVPAYFAFASDIAMYKEEWQKALDLAEEGLRVDPTHVGCGNCRAVVLAHMGRLKEAEEAIEQALENDPERSTCHANKGWILIQQGRSQEAIEHLREALRLNPNSDDAKRLALQALKGRHPLYGSFLQFFFRIIMRTKRLDKTIRDGLAVAMVIILLLMPPLRLLAVVVILCCYFAGHIFTFLLRFDPLGKQMLTPEQKRQNNKDLLWMAVITSIFLIYTGIQIDYFFHGPRVELQQAHKLSENGKPDEAESLYRQIMADADKEASKNKAKAANIYKDCWDALEQDKNANLAVQLDCLKAYGELQFKRAYWLSATELLEKYRQIAPANAPNLPKVLAMLGQIYQERKKRPEALSIYREMYSRISKNPSFDLLSIENALNRYVDLLTKTEDFKTADKIKAELTAAHQHRPQPNNQSY